MSLILKNAAFILIKISHIKTYYYKNLYCTIVFIPVIFSSYYNRKKY